MAVTTERSAGDTTIRPFTIDTPESELEDLRARIAATRFPEKEPVDDPSQGVQLATMQALAHYWLTQYDWRKCEEKLKALPHFITEIDGLDIHFVHIRSGHEDAMPLLVAHGWPGSVIEQLKIIEPLTNPTAHGASTTDAFHLVIPSMPGYGFSGKPAVTGWGPEHIARAWAELMKRLGYDRYVASGGDWGGPIVDLMGAQAPPGLVGIPTNFPGAVRPGVAAAAPTRGPAPAGPDCRGTRPYRQVRALSATDEDYALQVGPHPRAAGGPQMRVLPPLREAEGLLCNRRGLRTRAGHPPTDAVRNRGFPRRPGRLDARPRRDQLGADLSRLCRRSPGGPDPRRRPRQHHPLLADEHGDLLATSLLGKQARLLRPEGRGHPGSRERLP